MIPCCIVEQHHQVLPFWCRIAKNDPLDFILTLDHHTDILPAFSRSLEKPPIKPENVSHAIKLLHHDEHIDWALRAGIMKSAIILSHENFTTPAHPEMNVICPGIWPDSQKILNSSPEARLAAAQVLESEYLRLALSEDDLKKNYILDIDLDNFLCEAALSPKNPDFLMKLIKHAKGISFSLERDWQKILRLKGETITSIDILQKLRKLFQCFPLDFSESDCIVP